MTALTTHYPEFGWERPLRTRTREPGWPEAVVQGGLLTVASAEAVVPKLATDTLRVLASYSPPGGGEEVESLAPTPEAAVRLLLRRLPAPEGWDERLQETARWLWPDLHQRDGRVALLRERVLPLCLRWGSR